jgi:hypothetical protein
MPDTLLGEVTPGGGGDRKTADQILDRLAAHRTRINGSRSETPRWSGASGTVLGVAVDEDHLYAVHQHGLAGTPPRRRGAASWWWSTVTMQVQSRIEVGIGARSLAVNPVTDPADEVTITGASARGTPRRCAEVLGG